MTTGPLLTPVTTPEEFTVATEALLVAHVPAPPETDRPVGYGAAAPVQTVLLPVMVEGAASTVT